MRDPGAVVLKSTYCKTHPLPMKKSGIHVSFYDTAVYVTPSIEAMGARGYRPYLVHIKLLPAKTDSKL